MASATEIVFYPLKSDSDFGNSESVASQTFRQAFKTIRSQDGCQHIYWARQVENPLIGIAFITWDSVKHHQSFQVTDAFKPCVESMDAFLTGSPTYYHVHFDPLPLSSALTESVRVVEFSTDYFPTDYAFGDRQKRMDSLKRFIDKVKDLTDGIETVTGGWAMENIREPSSLELRTAFVTLLGMTNLAPAERLKKLESVKDDAHDESLHDSVTFHLTVERSYL